MSSPSIRNIPPVVRPTTPGQSIRNIPPVVRPTFPTNPGIGFQTGIDRSVNPGFRRFGVGQALAAQSFGGYFPSASFAPYGYSYPYPYYSYPFTYVPPLTTTSPYYSSPVYPEATIAPSFEPQPYQPQPSTDALVGEIQELQNQVQQLSDELAMRSKPEPPPAPREPEPPVVLVFRDGHRLETHGYAIMGTMLWAVDGASVSKFPLSDLNIGATQSENQKRGIEFKVPE
jgi:hypothetical protein